MEKPAASDPVAPEPVAPEPVASDPVLDEVAAHGLALMRLVTAIGEAEQLLVARATQSLKRHPEPAQADSLEQATAGGLAYDATAAAVAHAHPCAAVLTQCYERLSRAVRRTVALNRRIQAGWPAPRVSDEDRAAATLRDAVRATRARIRRETDGDTEAAERLFADLSARLDDPDFVDDLRDLPRREIIATLCREIGLPPKEKPRKNIEAIAGYGTNRPPDFGSAQQRRK